MSTKKPNGWALRLPVIALAILLLHPDEASAEFASRIYAFDVFSNNDGGNAAAAEVNILLRVSNGTALGDPTQFDDTKALFEILVDSNAPAMSVTDIYFEDGALLAISQVLNGIGTSFSQGASPPNLPGGNTLQPSFQTTVGFLADSDPPVQPNGVNPGETAGVLFDLQSGKTIFDVFSSIDTGFILHTFEEPEALLHLRVGIRIQGFTNGGSEAAILVPVPEASGIGFAVWAIAWAWIALVRKRRSCTQETTRNALA